MAGERVERLKEIYAAFNRRDLDASLDLVAADFTWTFDPGGILTGTHTGRERIREAIGQFTDVWDTIEGEIDTIEELDDDRIAIAQRLRGTMHEGEVQLELHHTVVWTFCGEEPVAAQEFLGRPEDVREKVRAGALRPPASG